MASSSTVKKTVVTNIGDIFSVTLGDKKKYFQLIARDLTQLNSDVIRAFRTAYPITANPSPSEIIKGEVDFYAHCVTKWGVQLGYWEKIGHCDNVGRLEHILFRDTNDYGRNPAAERVKLSNNWHVWRIGDERFTDVGKLKGENRQAEIGLVINPESIVYRMRTGEYDFPFYPSFE